MFEKILEGKGALITGGASGFGKGVAYAFADYGADLILVDINEELLEETAKLIAQKSGQKVIPIVCDVSKSDQVQAMAKQAFNELDNVYVLFNNAGIATHFFIDIIKRKEEHYDKIMDVNLKGQWLVSKYISLKMRRQKFEPLAGKIIHTASIAGMVVDTAIPVYSISKAGIIALMQLLAKTLAPKITVNSISPGMHITPMYLNEQVLRSHIDEGNVKTPLNRYGTVEDVVNIVSFLASPASNFITGHNFPIDGGIAEVGAPPNYMKTEY
ncbi:MAG: SDR family NAD(P)-dependent oxidoreductase [Candidatus Hermodarchaeota archaeon]